MTAYVLSYTQAPLTRCRADLGTNLPNELMKQYYVQRASAGLVITEFTSIDNDAITFHREPCIADDAQTAKWKEIVDAVHAAGEGTQINPTGLV